MSGDLQYVVDVLIQVNDGQAGSDLDRLGGKSKSLGDELYKVGGRLSEGFVHAGDVAFREMEKMAKWGAVGGVAAATYFTKVNAELEGTKIGLAAILNAQGVADGMSDGLKQSATWIEQMKKDSAVLPGSFEDLKSIVQSISTPAFAAGMSRQQVEKMASQAMAVSKIMGIGAETAGREMAQLLSGRAGAHNVLGMRLGLMGGEAQKFNADTAGNQVKRLTSELAKYQPAIDVFKGSFQALSTTFLDNVKRFGTAATGPLFERIKTTLGEVNDWFDANQGKVRYWSDRIGEFLVEAFDKGRQIIEDWAPAVEAFASNAYERLSQIWGEAAPTVSSIADSVQRMLSDKSTIDQLVHLAELWLLLKGGGMVGNLLGGGGGGGGGGLGLVGGLGGRLLLRGAGMGLEALGGGSAAAGGALVGGAAMAGWVGYEARREGAFGPNAGARSKYLSEQAEANSASEGKYETGTGEDAYRTGLKYIDQLSSTTDTSRGYEAVLKTLQDAGDTLRVGMLEAAYAAKEAALADQQKAGAAMGAADLEKAGRDYFHLDTLSSWMNEDKKHKQKIEQRRGGGGGGQHIQNVNISVSSNQAPGAIAKAVMSEIQRVRRNPTSSPHVTNFSAAPNR